MCCLGWPGLPSRSQLLSSRPCTASLDAQPQPPAAAFFLPPQSQCCHVCPESVRAVRLLSLFLSYPSACCPPATNTSFQKQVKLGLCWAQSPPGSPGIKARCMQCPLPVSSRSGLTFSPLNIFAFPSTLGSCPRAFAQAATRIPHALPSPIAFRS